MSRYSNWLSGLALLVVLILGGGYLLIGVLHINPAIPMTKVAVDLPESGSLRPGSDVVLRGVNIGTVESVHSIDGGVQVSLSYQRKYKIPSASGMKVQSLSALGEPIFEFIPTSSDGPYLVNGARLTSEPVDIPATIPDLLATTSDLLDQVNPKSVQVITTTLTQALTGLESVTPTINRGSTLLAEAILSRQPGLRQTLKNIMTMFRDADWLAPSIRGLPPAFIHLSSVANEDLIWLFRMAMRTQGDALFNSMIPEENYLVDYMKKIGPNVGAIGAALLPLAKSTGSLLGLVNFGDLLDQALHALPGDRLRVAVTIPH